MQRPVKIALWVVGSVVALLAVGAIAVALLVDPNDYKDEIAKAVRDATGRELALEGELKLSIFPWLALETGRAELGDAPGFGPGPFLTLERANVGVRLIPLLGGRMEVRRLELDGLRVKLVKDANGRGNWEDLTKEKPEAAPAESETTGGEIPTIAGLSIKNSSLDYHDLQKASRSRLQDLELESGRIEKGEPMDLELGFLLDEGEGTPQTRVKLKTEAMLDTDAKQYTLGDFELDATLPRGERPKDLTLGLRAPSLVANLEAQTLTIPELTLTAAGAQVTGAVEGKQILDAPALTGTLSLKPVSLRELLTELGNEAPKTRDPAALKTLAFDAKVVAGESSAMLEDLKLTLDDTHATGRAGIADFDTKALRFDLTVDQLDLDRYSGPEEEKKEESKKDAKPFELPLEQLKALNAEGKLRIGKLTLAGMKMSDVLFSVNADDGLVRLNPSQAKLYGGAYRGSIALDARGETAKLSIDEQLTNVDFAPLFSDAFDSKRLAGKGNFKAVLAARGNDSRQLLESLDGRMDFNVANGALKGTDLWYELRRARALFEREPPPAQPSTGETKFQALRGSAVVENGILENRDLTIDMDYLKVAGAGTFSLPTQKVDYSLTTTVYRVPEEGEGAEMQSLQAAQIPVRVSGTLDDLKIRPDVEARAKQEIEKKKQELTEKLTDKLGDWLGRKKKPEPTP